MVLGLAIGGAAGAAGGAVDLVLSRVMEVVLCFPTLFFVLALVAILEPIRFDDRPGDRADFLAQ